VIFALIDVAHAHFVWLERDGEGPARAYFGEWIDDIREKTGGLLDRFKAPRAFLGASNDSLPIKRNDNNLEIDAKGRGDVRFVGSSIPPREDKEKGGHNQDDLLRQSGPQRNYRQARSRVGTGRCQRQYPGLVFFGAPRLKLS